MVSRAIRAGPKTMRNLCLRKSIDNRDLYVQILLELIQGTKRPNHGRSSPMTDNDRMEDKETEKIVKNMWNECGR